MAIGTNQYTVEYNSVNLAANGTTVIATANTAANGKAYVVLHSVTINTKGATANTLTLYDNTAGSGTKIATIDTTGGTGSLFYDSICLTGITAVLASGTSADVTINWTKATN